MSREDDPRARPTSRLNRRDFLAASGGVAAGAVVASALPSGSAVAAQAKDYPVIDIAALDELAPGTEMAFEYPDVNSPAVLVRLQGAAEGGIGPDNSIVAFSLLCTHKGCPLNYLADRQMLVCPCHWSSFDPAKGGRIIIGQASQSLPQIALKVEGGMVQAHGVEGLIYGRHTNIL